MATIIEPQNRTVTLLIISEHMVWRSWRGWLSDSYLLHSSMQPSPTIVRAATHSTRSNSPSRWNGKEYAQSGHYRHEAEHQIEERLSEPLECSIEEEGKEKKKAATHRQLRCARIRRQSDDKHHTPFQIKNNRTWGSRKPGPGAVRRILSGSGCMPMPLPMPNDGKSQS